MSFDRLFYLISISKYIVLTQVNENAGQGGR
jgi:hypothetical protein